MKVSLIIPCYNEEEGIPNLATQLKPVLKELQANYETELILVDDGSTDKTSELLQEHFTGIKNTFILKHAKNRNLGGALKTGFAKATGDYIACLDSDCTYNPKGIIDMVNLMDPETAFVTVSPLHPDGEVKNVPSYRLFLTKSAALLYRILLNPKIYSFGAMVRVYNKDFIKNIEIKANDFLSVTEIYAKAALQKKKIVEYPTTLDVRQFGTSKMRLLRTIKGHLRLVSQILLYKAIGKEL